MQTLAAGRQTKQSGFTYLVMLIAVAVLSISSAVTSEVLSTSVLRDKETELIFRGQAYQRAIESYYQAHSRFQYPRRLADLVNDPRFPNTHHLRQLYTDPITDQAWLLIHSPDGGITGVASSSLRQPLKRANFSDELIHFQESVSYQDWQFIFVPIQAGE